MVPPLIIVGGYLIMAVFVCIIAILFCVAIIKSKGKLRLCIISVGFFILGAFIYSIFVIYETPYYMKWSCLRLLELG